MFHVTMQEADDPERQAEHKPGHHEHQAEQQEHVSPADVHTSCEHVGYVPLGLLIHVGEVDVALARLADKTAVVFASGVDLAIAEAAHSRHGTQSQAFFFTGQDAVMVGSSHAHASVGTATWLVQSPAHAKQTGLTGSAKQTQPDLIGEAQLLFPVEEGQTLLELTVICSHLMLLSN